MITKFSRGRTRWQIMNIMDY